MDRKNKVRQAITIAGSMFRQESQSYRVRMGYLLGIAIWAYWMHNFFQYVCDTGEPINILETFVVIEQDTLSIVFLVLGWLLVIADAPFIQSNTYFILYRSSRKSWNMGMVMYILLQAFLFVFCMAAVTIIASSFLGFSGEIWSNPVYTLAMDQNNDLGVKYHVTFAWSMMIKYMSVPQAFCSTFLFLFCYLAFLGVLLYVCNLLLRGIWGVIIVLGTHLIGYLLMQEGWVNISCIAHAVPGNFFDGTNAYLASPGMYLLVIIGLTFLSLWMVRKVDFREGEEDAA